MSEATAHTLLSRACRIDCACTSAGVLQAVEDLPVIDRTGLGDHHALLIAVSRRKLADLSLTAPASPGWFPPLRDLMEKR
ncbi:hypothetical protein ACWF94_02015 [Streptomyces sp. NPDC055078]